MPLLQGQRLQSKHRSILDEQPQTPEKKTDAHEKRIGERGRVDPFGGVQDQRGSETVTEIAQHTQQGDVRATDRGIADPSVEAHARDQHQIDQGFVDHEQTDQEGIEIPTAQEMWNERHVDRDEKTHHQAREIGSTVPSQRTMRVGHTEGNDDFHHDQWNAEKTECLFGNTISNREDLFSEESKADRDSLSQDQIGHGIRRRVAHGTDEKEQSQLSDTFLLQ